jgi:hypothetical protein
MCGNAALQQGGEGSNRIGDKGGFADLSAPSTVLAGAFCSFDVQLT